MATEMREEAQEWRVNPLLLPETEQESLEERCWKRLYRHFQRQEEQRRRPVRYPG